MYNLVTFEGDVNSLLDFDDDTKAKLVRAILWLDVFVLAIGKRVAGTLYVVNEVSVFETCEPETKQSARNLCGWGQILSITRSRRYVFLCVRM